MGLIERVNLFLLTWHPILIAILIVVVAALSLLLPFDTVAFFNANLRADANPTIVNGILTVTAIVFGLVAFEWREIKASGVEKLLLIVPLLLFLMYILEQYFISGIVGKTTNYVVFVATANCLFNILYTLPIYVAKETHDELDKRKSKHAP